MSATYVPDSTRTVTTSPFRLTRVAGFAGLFFALLVAFVNVLIGSMAPPAFDANASEITSFVTENKSMLKVALGVVPFGVISLFIFFAGSYPTLSATSRESAFWTRVGMVGLVLIEVLFLARTIFELVLLANIDTLAAEPTLVEMLWQLQSATLIINGLGVGLALLGLSRAARLSGLIPAWQEILGLGAAFGFLVAGIGAVAALEGSMIGMVGLVAFVGWLVWLALTSVRLLRTDRA